MNPLSGWLMTSAPIQRFDLSAMPGTLASESPGLPAAASRGPLARPPSIGESVTPAGPAAVVSVIICGVHVQKPAVRTSKRRAEIHPQTPQPFLSCPFALNLAASPRDVFGRRIFAAHVKPSAVNDVKFRWRNTR